MKLWMLIVIFGQVTGTVGPLPYDMDECWSRIDDMRLNMAADQSEGRTAIIDGRMATPDDITLTCARIDNRPELGVAFADLDLLPEIDAKTGAH